MYSPIQDISYYTRCYIYLYLPAKTLENLFFIAGKTPFFPKLPKTINYILKKHATHYCRRSTAFHGGTKDSF